ncbi:MAG: type II toxin-antitoxin system HicB family antitoxin [Prevotellaceae bacterium]|jgi:predicted RNase H-like HicB family nuclease|nr:type II toxin-antitoxin system HicB family antitoxin [Prevotellaceae bacterium]
MEKVIIHVDYEDNFQAWLKELAGCVAVGDTMEDLQHNIKESISMHLEGMREDEETIPAAFNGQYELEYKLNTRALLKYSSNTVKMSAISEITGIAPQVLSHYASGVRNASEKVRTKIVFALHRLGKELLTVE